MSKNHTEARAPSFTVRASELQAGFVEVTFASRPGVDVRAELKRCGYRYSYRGHCWYGKAEKLPERYR
jgi:hypothetical protein